MEEYRRITYKLRSRSRLEDTLERGPLSHVLRGLPGGLGLLLELVLADLGADLCDFLREHGLLTLGNATGIELDHLPADGRQPLPLEARERRWGAFGEGLGPSTLFVLPAVFVLPVGFG